MPMAVKRIQTERWERDQGTPLVQVIRNVYLRK